MANDLNKTLHRLRLIPNFRTLICKCLGFQKGKIRFCQFHLSLQCIHYCQVQCQPQMTLAVACHQIMSQERVTGSAHSAKTLIFTGGKSATNAKPPLLEVEAVEVAEDEVVGVGKPTISTKTPPPSLHCVTSSCTSVSATPNNSILCRQKRKSASKNSYCPQPNSKGNKKCCFH